MLAIYVSAGYDKNGNSRRGWIVYRNSGFMEAFIEEGCLGPSALRVAGYEDVPRTEEALRISTTAYRELRKSRPPRHRRRLFDDASMPFVGGKR